MKPISFPEANKNPTKPANMTDEECGSLPVYNGNYILNYPVAI